MSHARRHEQQKTGTQQATQTSNADPARTSTPAERVNVFTLALASTACWVRWSHTTRLNRAPPIAPLDPLAHRNVTGQAVQLIAISRAVSLFRRERFSPPI